MPEDFTYPFTRTARPRLCFALTPSGGLCITSKGRDIAYVPTWGLAKFSKDLSAWLLENSPPKPLGYYPDGDPINVGDAVLVPYSYLNGHEYTGVVVATPAGEYSDPWIWLARDDGQRGSGPAGEWSVRATQVHKLPVVPPSIEERLAALEARLGV